MSGEMGYTMDLNAQWHVLNALKPADAIISDICKITFETRVITKDTPMPCNAIGTPR
jgi:hypothetical protein